MSMSRRWSENVFESQPDSKDAARLGVYAATASIWRKDE